MAINRRQGYGFTSFKEDVKLDADIDILVQWLQSKVPSHWGLFKPYNGNGNRVSCWIMKMGDGPGEADKLKWGEVNKRVGSGMRFCARGVGVRVSFFFLRLKFIRTSKTKILLTFHCIMIKTTLKMTIQFT